MVHSIRAMKKVNASNYQKDERFVSVARSVAQILQTTNVVTPVEVLLRLGRITKQEYEDWRFGRIAYLERVCLGNLSKLNRLLRILDQHCRAIGLTPTNSAYRKWGRHGNRDPLRFSKSGDPNLEAAYSRHYIAKGPLIARDSDGHSLLAASANDEARMINESKPQ